MADNTIQENVSTVDVSGYIQKLVKLIPAEIIVLYSTIMAFIPASLTAQLAIIGICTVVTPLYLIFTMKVKNVGQIIVTTLAFLVFTFASGGSIATIAGYQSWMPGALLALFTMITPMFVKSNDTAPVTTSAASGVGSSKAWREV